MHEHRVLTATQLTRLAFTGTRCAQRRLRMLHEYAVLDSFRPLVARGSAPQHYTLGRTGAQVLAAQHATDLAATGWRSSATGRIGYSMTLGHDIAVNELFTLLSAHTRTARAPGTGLALWLSARSAARRWGDLTRPDAYAHWITDDHRLLPLFFEHDTGTENLARLEARIDTYANFATTTGTRPALLIHTATTTRERNLRRRLASLARGHGLLVATTSAEYAASTPWGRCWTPLHPDWPRTTLDGLATCWPDLTEAPGLDTDSEQHIPQPFADPVPPLPPGEE
ncbi:replication-relaxation family protein [Streptomyces boninensis]|uniref:replication-relaxation family protein n=1 Tax=Streptomyces boninensis TaxID=2039455 RepID=UPI003B214F42